MKAKLQVPSPKLQGSTNRRNGANYPDAGHAIWLVSDSSPVDGPARHPFDLEERAARFGEAIIRFAKRVPRGPVDDRLIDQLVGCGTSLGANYCEANEGVSKKDFKFSVARCRKEAKETKFFLRMIAAAEPSLTHDARELFREAKELHLIFCAMFRNAG